MAERLKAKAASAFNPAEQVGLRSAVPESETTDEARTICQRSRSHAWRRRSMATETTVPEEKDYPKTPTVPSGHL